jgi:N-methylhydantoinase A
VTYQIAVDIGGTFTDLVALDTETGEVRVNKSSSMAKEPIKAVLRVIDKAGIPAPDIELFIHGTTVATNALIERKGTRVAFVTNRGFRDVIFIQNANRRDLYSLIWKKPRPLVSRYDCLEIACRTDSSGAELTSLLQADLDGAIAHIKAEKIRSVAISFLFSYLNPKHEIEVARQLRAAIPGISISLSHEVYPRWRENDRGHTTIADAYLKPMLSRYLDNLGRGFRDAGSPARLLVMKSNGGVVEGEAAAEQPANYLVSGPVGGVLGGTHFGTLAGFKKIMTIDIGGTSCDVSLIVDGQPRRAANYEIDVGMPVKAPMVDIRTIGAGGGSIGWIDAGGLLRAGPQSAGSNPGPACYGQGGTEPTITDANLVLGRLNAHYFCGGDIPLEATLARKAVQGVAKRLGRSVEETAHAMIKLANNNMVDALRVISVEQGIDPRDFALVAFGGAGALHAVEIAELIGISKVLVPPYPGNTSAFGLLTAGLRSDLSTTLLLRGEEPDALARVNDRLVPLRERALATLRREGFKGEPEIEQRLEMRFFGQNYHREIKVTSTAPLLKQDFADAFAAFHADYVDFYGYDQPGESVEIVGMVVTAIGQRKGPAAHFRKAESTGRKETTRDVSFALGGFQPTAIVQRETIGVGETRVGPMIVEEALSTTVVPPGCKLTVLESASMLIELPAEENASR